MAELTIDYSAWKSWWKCPWNWAELYLNKKRKRWPDAQRDDPLAIGQLVHAGLETWQREGRPEIPSSVVEEVGPTKEALALAEGLVIGYAQRYPTEEWPLVVCEKPLRFPVLDKLNGIAKVDAYFYVPELTTIDSGVPGVTCTLSPGWWAREYKTKDQGLDVAKWMQSWEVNMQASFQLLALREEVKKQRLEGEVQGVLVSVLEKPKIYAPKRKCKQCQQYFEFAAWIPTGDGKHGCPMCGNLQKLAAVSTEARPEASFFRMVVQRTEERLGKDLQEIQQVASQMAKVSEEGMESFPPNRESCLIVRLGECPYYRPHTHGGSTKDNPDYMDTEDYLGLEEPKSEE